MRKNKKCTGRILSDNRNSFTVTLFMEFQGKECIFLQISSHPFLIEEFSEEIGGAF
jgi:hypothetical protein